MMSAALNHYRQFHGLGEVEEQIRSGIFRVSGLNRTTAVVEHRDGGDANLVQKSLGTTTFAPITLERERT